MEKAEADKSKAEMAGEGRIDRKYLKDQRNKPEQGGYADGEELAVPTSRSSWQGLPRCPMLNSTSIGEKDT